MKTAAVMAAAQEACVVAGRAVAWAVAAGSDRSRLVAVAAVRRAQSVAAARVAVRVEDWAPG